MCQRPEAARESETAFSIPVRKSARDGGSCGSTIMCQRPEAVSEAKPRFCGAPASRTGMCGLADEKPMCQRPEAVSEAKPRFYGAPASRTGMCGLADELTISLLNLRQLSSPRRQPPVVQLRKRRFAGAGDAVQVGGGFFPVHQPSDDFPFGHVLIEIGQRL